MGDYSLSVRKKEIIKTDQSPKLKNRLSSNQFSENVKKIGDSIYMPELRGELIY